MPVLMPLLLVYAHKWAQAVYTPHFLTLSKMKPKAKMNIDELNSSIVTLLAQRILTSIICNII